MKTLIPTSMICVAVAILCLQTRGESPETKLIQKYEYASVRYMGGGRTSFVWPDGKVEKFSSLTDLKRPDTADERMFHLTVAINIMARRGYEPVAIPSMSSSPDDVVMRRPVSRE